MKTRISIILLFISLALLMIYAADVQWGFLPLSPSVRGGGLGGSAVILSIIAFAISLKGTIQHSCNFASNKRWTNSWWYGSRVLSGLSRNNKGSSPDHIWNDGLGNPSYCTRDRENCYDSKTFCLNSATQQMDHQVRKFLILQVAKFH